ncbi:DNA replication domain protein [Achromobacter insuavis]|uniref:DNA replication domain protein n=1 Tax=Achromobacter insuavis TaxID=1287735 RepID=UPI000E301B6F|nr:DNA replication domain protein [Achromobacter insuavis]
MAADWIKMRVDLPTHPKVVRIASACKADRLRVIGGLLSVWGLFDAHSIDGQLEGYTPDVLDETIGFPGFSAAMIGVGWLEFDGFSLWMPQFEEHNGQSAKKRAQDADRKRNDRNSSASEADKKRTREEKNRKEKDNPQSPLPGVEGWLLPDWVPAEPWQQFEEMRRKKKKPMTDAARKLAVTKLDTLRTAGHDVATVIGQSVLHAWDSFYELKGGAAQAVPGDEQPWTGAV